MTFIKTTLIAAAAAMALSSGAAFAKAPASLAKPRSEASLACSKQADEQKLTGKPRKAFRTDCLKKAKAAASPAKPAAAKPAATKPAVTAPATKAPAATTPTAPAKKN